MNPPDPEMASNLSETNKPPRLALAYLFLWLSLLSISLGIWFTLLSAFGVNWEEGIGWRSIGFYATNAIVLGTGLTGIVLLVLWKWQHVPYEWQPGAVILVYLGIFELIRVCAVTIDLAIPDSGLIYDETKHNIYKIMAISQNGFAVCLFVGWMVRNKLSIGWRFGLTALALQNLFDVCQVVFPRMIPAAILGPISTSVLIHNGSLFIVLVVALGDLAQGCSRGWLHWIGVAGLLIFSWSWCYSLFF
ncbi:hypothetical protein [Blastopirellula marina]|nr:hypothetical protein [Blastopirellula marina]